MDLTCISNGATGQPIAMVPYSITGHLPTLVLQSRGEKVTGQVISDGGFTFQTMMVQHPTQTVVQHAQTVVQHQQMVVQNPQMVVQNPTVTAETTFQSVINSDHHLATTHQLTPS